jgi:DNA repair exonuclease SbcCD nuclease subunit
VDVAATYPRAVPDCFNIGLLHTSAEGRRGHVDYAPTSRRTLRRHGYDYWALGHVHAREVIAKEPWIVFPGNLQGRNPRETGAKGATLVRVARGRVHSVEARSLASLRFENLSVDISDADHFDEVLERARRAIEQLVAPYSGASTVLELTLGGLEGAAKVLAVPPHQRMEAVLAMTREFDQGRIVLDQIWLDAGPIAGAWPLARAA